MKVSLHSLLYYVPDIPVMWITKIDLLFAGMHPRVLVDGFEIAKKATMEFLEKFKTPVVMGDSPDKEILKMVARTTLRTKVIFSSIYALKLCLRCQCG